MTSREITLNDYPILIPFWQENYFVGDMDNLERFTIFLEKNPGLSMLAEHEGNIFGTVLGSFDGRRGYLQKVVVAKSYRKKGIGKQLIEQVITKFKSLGTTYVPISVEEDIVDFYKNCGFKTTTQISMNIEI